MFCSKCGSQINNDALFCTFCGSPTMLAPAAARSASSVQSVPVQCAPMVQGAAVQRVPAAQSVPVPRSIPVSSKELGAGGAWGAAASLPAVEPDTLVAGGGAAETGGAESLKSAESADTESESGAEGFIYEPDGENRAAGAPSVEPLPAAGPVNAVETVTAGARGAQPELAVFEPALPPAAADMGLNGLNALAEPAASDISAELAEKPAKYYTFGHIALCLAAVGVMAIVAGIFAGLYFSVI